MTIIRLPFGATPLIVVSRHPAAVDFLAAELGLMLGGTGGVTPGGDIVVFANGDEFTIPVLTVATPDDVKGRLIVGNVPLSLACLAAPGGAAGGTVLAIEFTGEAPRGIEYTLEDMRAAGAHLVEYHVQKAVPTR